MLRATTFLFGLGSFIVGQFESSDRLVKLLLLLISAYWLASNEVDPDLWGHIKYGEDLLLSGRLPTTDPYSYTAGGLTWINHEVAAELSLALLARVGPAAILVFKWTLGLSALGLALFLSRRHRITLIPWNLMAVPAVASIALGWAARPQLFSYILFVFLLLILECGQRRPWMITWSIPLLALWVNFHGGFLFGLGILGIYLAVRILEELYTNGLENRRTLVLWCVVGVSALSATLCNPYGIGIYFGLVRELGIPRIQIGEWRPLPWIAMQFLQINLLMLCTVFALLGSRRHLALHRWALLIVMLIETQLHLRHAVFLALAVLAWLPEHFQDAWDRLVTRLRRRPKQAEEISSSPASVPGWLFFATGFLAAVILVGAIVNKLTAIRVDRSIYPVDAFRFLAEHDLHGKIVVPFNWAQYVIYVFHPKLQVSFDGRYGTVYDTLLLDMNFDLWFPDDPSIRFRSPTSPPFDPEKILDHLQPNLVLVDRHYHQAAEVLAKHNDWVILYQDGIAQIFGRKDQYDVPGTPTYFLETKRIVISQPSGWVPFPGRPP